MAPIHHRNGSLEQQDSDFDKPTQSSGSSSKRTQSKVGREKGTHDDVYFLIPRKVTVLYGPYMFQGMMDYRPERVQGLKAFLEKLGVTVEQTPCLDHVNLCRVWFLDELIFSCKLTDLIFGGDGELDPVCWKAAECLEKRIKEVLEGLRKQKLMTPEELKKPFCPCFQVDHGLDDRQNQFQQRTSIGSSSGMTRGSEARSSDFGEDLTEKRPQYKYLS